jgi:hypothetical protein
MGSIEIAIKTTFITEFIRRETMTVLNGTGLKALQISNDGFAFDSTTGATYTLNRCGRTVLQKLQEGENRSQIVTVLADRFDISQSSAERDLADFLQQIESLGIALRSASKPQGVAS